MKTNTDKTTIDISNESLEYARQRINPYSVFAESKADVCFDEGFDAGANWQKEKDKAIQDRLIEALKAIEARANGDWDNTALIKFGSLTSEFDNDVLHIIKTTLQSIEDIKTL